MFILICLVRRVINPFITVAITVLVAKHWEDSKIFKASSLGHPATMSLRDFFCSPDWKGTPSGHSCHIASTGLGANRFDRLNGSLVFIGFHWFSGLSKTFFLSISGVQK